MVYKISVKKKWVATDGWRGYERPIYAIAGASDTGMWEDSPAPSNKVNDELKSLKSFLTQKGIKSKIVTTKSSNNFMVKRWIVVPSEQMDEAKKVYEEYEQSKHPEYIHD